MPEIREVAPKYLQIAGYIRDEIVRGDRPEGSEVPSEREVAATWNVARPTASKALGVLKQQGLIESRRGSGSYVRKPQAAPRARERYERARELGTMYSADEAVRFLDVGVIAGPRHVTDNLGLAAGSNVVQRRRLISRVSGPVEVSTSWFASTLTDHAPRLLDPERIRGGTGAYVQSVTSRTLAYVRDQVSARAASPAEAAQLGLPEFSPVLAYWLTVYDTDDVPVQFDEAIYPPEHWALRQEYPIET